MEALECFHAAQRVGFPVNRCAAARWDCWMLTGQFEKAWEESDLIAWTGAPDPHRFWDGQSWDGKRVMLRCLHGLGDTIQFIRYASLLRGTCRGLTVQTHPQLRTLLEGVAGVDRVITWGRDYVDDLSAWDKQMEVTELPRAFRARAETLPACPYIEVPRERMEWASGLFPQRHGFRIGLCWQSGPWDSNRSIRLSQLQPLLNRKQHQIFSLQKDVDAGPTLELEKYARDVRDTAALILNLDLVITVDTMTAHLAGALGRPVWILLPQFADWRWMLDRCDSPWYPTARLFRQRQQGNWGPVIDEVLELLRSYESESGDSGDRPHPNRTCRVPILAESR